MARFTITYTCEGQYQVTDIEAGHLPQALAQFLENGQLYEQIISITRTSSFNLYD